MSVLSLDPPPGTAPPVPHENAPPPGSVLPAHYARCFGCGDEHPTGLHLVATVREGVTLDAVVRLTEAHQGAPGIAHGGLVAAAFDEAMGFVNWLLRRPAVTGRLETDFRLPVPVGRELHIAVRCVGVVGRKVYTRAEGRLDGPDGPVAARAAGLFLAVPMSHFAEHGRGAEHGWGARTRPAGERS